MQVAIVTHGGAGSPELWNDGCVIAASAGLEKLLQNESAFQATTHATVSLEDDGRFNAGVGSAIRLDGESVEMDAAIMDSEGRLGAVVTIHGVKNPILIASRITETPHHILAGEGAVAFARRNGFPDFNKRSDWAKKRYEQMKGALSSGNAELKRSLEEHWNFERPFREVFPSDTVGAVARDHRGHFAVAVSTGGSGAMLKGRVGDTPLIGSGFFAGEMGAVAVTGIGEEIMKQLLAKTIYDLLVDGKTPEIACQQGVKLFPSNIPIGAIAVGKQGAASYCNTQMACAILEK